MTKTLTETIATRAGARARLGSTPRRRAVGKKAKAGLVVSLIWLVLIIVAAIIVPLLPLPSYAMPIGKPLEAPSLSSVAMWLGTDQLGRSLLVRIIYGAQISLLVATVSGLSAFVLGTVLGTLAGYFRRGTDGVISIAADTLLAFPSLILLMVLSAIFRPSITTVLFGLAVSATPQFIRVARAQTISWVTRDFVSASRHLGAGNVRIMFREILPNLLPSLAAYLPVVMAALIVAEGSLAFLGLGVPPPQPSWGGMIQAGVSRLADAPQLVFIPALAVFLTVYSLNQLGDNLRTRYDKTIGD